MKYISIIALISLSGCATTMTESNCSKLGKARDAAILVRNAANATILGIDNVCPFMEPAQ